MRSVACLVIGAMLLAACSHPTSETYEAADVGRPIETTQGSVVASRVVQITGDDEGLLGPAAGGAVGAATGGLVFDSGWSALLAGLIGAGAGYLAQSQLNDREGIEYVLQMADGRTVTLVQNRQTGEAPLPPGTPVLVQIGGQYTRVIEDPSPDRAGPGGGWVDPDALPSEASGGGLIEPPSSDLDPGASPDPEPSVAGDAETASPMFQ